MKFLRKTWIQSMVFGIAALFFTASFSPAQETSFAKGTKAYTKEDYKTAVTYLKEYVEKKPDAYAYYLIGYALYKMKNHPESVRYFKEAYTLDPAVSPVPGR